MPSWPITKLGLFEFNKKWRAITNKSEQLALKQEKGCRTLVGSTRINVVKSNGLIQCNDSNGAALPPNYGSGGTTEELMTARSTISFDLILFVVPSLSRALCQELQRRPSPIGEVGYVWAFIQLQISSNSFETME